MSSSGTPLDVDTKPYKYKIAQGEITGASIVNKFGFNLDVNSGTPEVIAAFGGSFDPLTNIISVAQTLTITYNSSTDGLGTTGALSLLITHINSSDNEVTELHTLGNTGSDTTSFTTKGVNRMLIFSNGGDITANNDITATATIDGTTQALIIQGQSITQQLILHTGIGKQYLMDSYDFDILKVTGGGGGSPKITLIGYSWSRVTETLYEFTRRKLDADVSNNIESPRNKVYSFLGREVVYWVLETDTNNTEIDGTFGGVILDA